MTVSLRPASQLSGGRGAVSPIAWRLTTSKVTSCMWIGWASAVKLWSSQTSMAPTAGFSVGGSSQPSGFPLWSGLSVPRSASAGAKGSPCAQSRMTLPFSSVLTRTVADSCSLSETWRVLVAVPSGATAGSASWLGGVLVSTLVAALTRKRITCPVVSGSAGSKSTPGAPPPKGSSGAMFSRMISLPTARFVKSTITSPRSAGPSSISGRLDRRGQEAALVADLPQRQPVGEAQNQEARVAAVQEAEAVASLLHVERGPGGAVDDDRVAEELRVPDRRDVARAAAGRIGHERDLQLGRVEAFEECAVVGVGQRAVLGEGAVLDRDRDLEVVQARRVAERRRRTREDALHGVAGSAAQQVEPGRPSVDVGARHAERVVVVPQRPRALVVVVLEHSATGRPRLMKLPLSLGLELAVSGASQGVPGRDVARPG